MRLRTKLQRAYGKGFLDGTWDTKINEEFSGRPDDDHVANAYRMGWIRGHQQMGTAMFVRSEINLTSMSGSGTTTLTFEAIRL